MGSLAEGSLPLFSLLMEVVTLALVKRRTREKLATSAGVLNHARSCWTRVLTGLWFVWEYPLALDVMESPTGSPEEGLEGDCVGKTES